MTCTKSHSAKNKNRQLPRVFYRWHRRIGATAALFVVWMAVSGWLLNHSDSLKLAQHPIHNAKLANWYNLHYQAPTQAFTSLHHWLVNNVLDGKLLSTELHDPIGMSETENLIAIANNHELILLNAQRELIDKLSDTNLPVKNIQKIGNGCDGIAIAIAIADDHKVFVTQDGIDWKICSESIIWSTTDSITAQQLNDSEPLLIPEVSLEKVILDLHTGHFFGRFGVYVVDAIGLCLVLLALSGLWLFLRMGTRQK